MQANWEHLYYSASFAVIQLWAIPCPRLWNRLSISVDSPLCQVSHSFWSTQPSPCSDEAVHVESCSCHSSGRPAFPALVEERRPQSHPWRRARQHVRPSGSSRGVRGWSPRPLRRAVHIGDEGSHFGFDPCSQWSVPQMTSKMVITVAEFPIFLDLKVLCWSPKILHRGVKVALVVTYQRLWNWSLWMI